MALEIISVPAEVEDNVIQLGSYQPWHNALQPTHLFGHSSRTKNLVQLTEFIDLQVTLEKDEDPYGLEMAAFLDKSYVEGRQFPKMLVFFFKLIIVLLLVILDWIWMGW